MASKRNAFRNQPIEAEKQKPNFAKKGAFGLVSEAVARVYKNAIAYIEKSQNGWYYYGERDDLPNQIIEHINNSGTATIAINKLKQFIEADGFADEATGNAMANKDQTWNEVLSEIVENQCKLNGFALKEFFNYENKIVETKVVPIPWIRKRNDNFRVNRLMGEMSKMENHTITYRAYNGDLDKYQRREIIKQEQKEHSQQLGEIFYCFRTKLGRNYDLYPVPDFYAGIEDIISDGAISQLEASNILQGWRAQVVVATGVIDDQNEDDDGKTPKDYFDENLEQFCGADAARVLHLQASTPEEMAKVTVLDNKEIIDMTEKSTIRVGEKVCRLAGVPPILCGFKTAGTLGNVQELKNTMDLFYISIINIQNYITYKLNSLKPNLLNGENLDFTISKLNPFSLLPDSILSRLTDQEVRLLFEIPKVQTEIDELGQPITAIDTEADTTNSVLRDLTGRQIQGFQRIIRKFNQDQFTYEQAAVLLKSSYGFTDEEVDIFLVTKEEEEEEDAIN